MITLRDTIAPYEGSHLFAIVGHGLQDGLQRRDGHGHVYQVSGEEEVVQVAEEREGKVPQVVQERLQRL